jgi:hypothetical protein
VSQQPTIQVHDACDPSDERTSSSRDLGASILSASSIASVRVVRPGLTAPLAPGHGLLTRLAAPGVIALRHQLGKAPPLSRSIAPPSVGRMVATPQVGGLHHLYDRVAAQSANHSPPTHIVDGTAVPCTSKALAFNKPLPARGHHSPVESVARLRGRRHVQAAQLTGIDLPVATASAIHRCAPDRPKLHRRRTVCGS